MELLSEDPDPSNGLCADLDQRPGALQSALAIAAAVVERLAPPALADPSETHAPDSKEKIADSEAAGLQRLSESIGRFSTPAAIKDGPQRTVRRAAEKDRRTDGSLLMATQAGKPTQRGEKEPDRSEGREHEHRRIAQH